MLFKVGLAALTVYAQTSSTECGEITQVDSVVSEECQDEFCYKVQFSCPGGSTPSHLNTFKCKKGVWHPALGANELIECVANDIDCSYDQLPSISDGVIANCNDAGCDYSCENGLEPTTIAASCDRQFGLWNLTGQNSSRKIRCPKTPKEPKHQMRAADKCGEFTGFDENTVEEVECNKKYCTYRCKEGLHHITSSIAKCTNGGGWTLEGNTQYIRCFGLENTWHESWKRSDGIYRPPFGCNPDAIRHVTLADCVNEAKGAITQCNVICKGKVIDTTRCINHRGKWSEEWFDC